LAFAQGNEYVTEQLTRSLSAFNSLAGTELDAKTALNSTIGRTLARALESEYCSDMMVDDWNQLITNIKNGDSSTANMDKWEPSTWPKHAKGVGTVAAPRGALGHWIVINDGKIENYQCVVPSTWNSSPRDVDGNIGAFEAALMNTPVERADEPVEILRTLHSFDPCMACATHVMSPDGEELANVKVR
jgi:hydrogenase large subunit